MKKLLVFVTAALFASYAFAAGAPLNPVFGFVDAGNVNVNGYSNATQLQLRGSDIMNAANYLIPELAVSTVYEHVNANDLAIGTARAGYPFIDAGIPTYAPNSPVDSAFSGFSTTVGFAQDAGSPLNLTTGAFTISMLVSAPVSATAEPLQVGTSSTNGYFIYVAGANVSFINGLTSGGATTSGGFIYGLGHVNLIMCGSDGVGNYWVQVNGGTAVSTAIAAPTAGATTVSLGNNASLPWGGSIYELLATNMTPSAANFTVIWNSVAPKLGAPGIYESGADGGTPASTPAFIEHGSLQLSAATNVCHLFNRTFTGTPDCVVGLGRGAPTISGAPSFDAGVAGICAFESTSTTAEVTYQCIGN